MIYFPANNKNVLKSCFNQYLKKRSNTQSNGTFDLNFIACKFIMRKSEIAIKTKEVKKK